MTFRPEVLAFPSTNATMTHDSWLKITGIIKTKQKATRRLTIASLGTFSKYFVVTKLIITYIMTQLLRILITFSKSESVCFVFFIAELIGGFLSNSIAILSDASHLLTDLSSFALSLIALKVTQESVSQIIHSIISNIISHLTSSGQKIRNIIMDTLVSNSSLHLVTLHLYGWSRRHFCLKLWKGFKI